MANLAFNYDGEKYVSDVFSGGKVVQLSFEKAGTQVILIESRLATGLAWKTVDSRIVERTMIINIPYAGEGQEFRITCLLQPSTAEIVQQSQNGGGSQPAPDSVGSEQIVDGSVEMEDLNKKVKDAMVTGDDRVTQDELDKFNV